MMFSPSLHCLVRESLLSRPSPPVRRRWSNTVCVCGGGVCECVEGGVCVGEEGVSVNVSVYVSVCV